MLCCAIVLNVMVKIRVKMEIRFIWNSIGVKGMNVIAKIYICLTDSASNPGKRIHPTKHSVLPFPGSKARSTDPFCNHFREDYFGKEKTVCTVHGRHGD